MSLIFLHNHNSYKELHHKSLIWSWSCPYCWWSKRTAWRLKNLCSEIDKSWLYLDCHRYRHPVKRRSGSSWSLLTHPQPFSKTPPCQWSTRIPLWWSGWECPLKQSPPCRPVHLDWQSSRGTHQIHYPTLLEVQSLSNTLEQRATRGHQFWLHFFCPRTHLVERCDCPASCNRKLRQQN